MTSTPQIAPKPKRKEGITLKFGQVTNPHLRSGINKLDQFTDWEDSKDLYRMAKFKGMFDREEKKAMLWYQKLVHKHAIMIQQKKKSEITGNMEDVFDSQGKAVMRPKQGPGANGQMTIQFKDQKAFDQDIRIFDNHEFTCNVFRFKCKDLEEAGLTPGEMRACAKMIDDLPEDLVDDGLDEEILRRELQDELEGDHDELNGDEPQDNGEPVPAEAELEKTVIVQPPA